MIRQVSYSLLPKSLPILSGTGCMYLHGRTSQRKQTKQQHRVSTRLWPNTTSYKIETDRIKIHLSHAESICSKKPLMNSNIPFGGEDSRIFDDSFPPCPHVGPVTMTPLVGCSPLRRLLFLHKLRLILPCNPEKLRQLAFSKHDTNPANTICMI